MIMMTGEQRTWLLGFLSVRLGFCLLWTMTALPEVKYAALDFVNAAHWQQLQQRYGSLAHLQTVGREPAAR